jgi:HPt (histidine-containing phosphotransfer) domain-containing protein
MLDAEVVQGLVELEKDDNAGLIAQLHSLFQKSAPDSMRVILEGVAAANANAVKGAAHSLKSSCGNLGAMEMSRICQELETSAGAGDLTNAPTLLAELKEQYPIVDQELSALVASLK